MPHSVRGIRPNFSLCRLPFMWCRHCQQDVPAARGAAGLQAAGPPACSRCRQAFTALPGDSRPALKLAAMADCGVSLEEFDRAEQQAPTLARPPLSGGEEGYRRLERLLRPQLRSDFGHGSPLLREPVTLTDIGSGAERIDPLLRIAPSRLRDAAQGADAHRPRSAWGVNLLLVLGAITFAGGVGLLVVANMLIHQLAWRWGFALTIAGEGLLIGGLAAMAVRLWRNSRRMNSQLEVIARRLGDVQASVGGAALFPNNSLWRIDAGEPADRFERSAVAVR